MDQLILTWDMISVCFACPGLPINDIYDITQIMLEKLLEVWGRGYQQQSLY